ncbi:MAG: hypothetical protein HYT80_06760 [Euryarchaeota archaeon]|nr:hypothetical protein [Euryarchaeota archaeon]
MRASRAAVGSLLLVAVLFLSGCIATDPTAAIRNFEAIPADAGSVVGDGDFRLEIKVVSEAADGPPLAGAPVLIYPIEKPIGPPSTNFLHTHNATYGGRTDANGILVANLIPGRTYSFQATADGHTREFRHVIRMDRHTLNPFPVVLFQSNKTVELTGTLPATPAYGKVPALNVKGSLTSTKATTWLREVDFHPRNDTKLDREYIARLATLRATVTWVNSPSSYGDLGIRVAFDRPFVFENDVATEAMGQGSETMTLNEDVLEWPTTHKKGALRAGPMTRMPVVTTGGLAYKVTLEATFSTDPAPGFLWPYCRSPYCVYEPE